MPLSKYCKLYPLKKDHDTVMLFSTKKASAVIVPSSFIQDIEKGGLSDEEKETLTQLEFLVQSEEDEKKEILRFTDELNALNIKLNAVVVLNLDCNLGCKYCFEGTRKGKLYMSVETADFFIDFINNYNFSNKEELELTFYGGEPLLSVDMMVYISEKLRPIAQNKGMKFSFALVTNGTLLTPHIVEKLKPLGLKAATITLDGPKEVHDAFRPFTSGTGSFDTIVRNVKDVCTMMSLAIGGNYTRDNYREFPKMLDYLIETGITPANISSVKFSPVTNETAEFALPDFHDGCESISEPWLFEASVYLREEILKRGFRTQKITPSPCVIEKNDSFVVNYDGALYKCPGFIGRQGLSVGDVRTGVTDYRSSHCLDNWKNEECLACAYLPLCFGGCKYMKLIQNNEICGVDCKKTFYDATLEAMIAQDIRSEKSDEK